MQLSINSLYLATEGEGIHLGKVQIFLRLQGCNIGCLNCDSKDTWDFQKGDFLSLDEIHDRLETISKSQLRPVKRISITGGDPLHPSHTPALTVLVGQLKAKGYYINIEASGTRLCHDIFDRLDFISFDIKPPSTGVKFNLELVKKLREQYPHKFQIKTVIETKEDFSFAWDCFRELEAEKEIDFPWCLTPCYRPQTTMEQVPFEMILQLNQAYGGPFRVVGQQHKWVFGPDRKQI